MMFRRPEDVVCDRCGAELPWVEIQTWGSLERDYVPTADCTCPRPVCPSCRTDLRDGRCNGMDCYAFGLLVPIPTMV